MSVLVLLVGLEQASSFLYSVDSFHKHILLNADVWEYKKHRIKDAFDRQGLCIKMACMHVTMCVCACVYVMCVGGGGGRGQGVGNGSMHACAYICMCRCTQVSE